MVECLTSQCEALSPAVLSTHCRILEKQRSHIQFFPVIFKEMCHGSLCLLREEYQHLPKVSTHTPKASPLTASTLSTHILEELVIPSDNG